MELIIRFDKAAEGLIKSLVSAIEGVGVGAVVEVPEPKPEPVAEPKPEPVAEPKPEPKPEPAAGFDAEAARAQIKRLGVKLVQAGRKADCAAMLQQVGAGKLSEVTAEKLPELLALYEAAVQ